jgi:AcrR family transcriptional regulator
LEAALRLFDEQGFRDASMAALAEEAGVGTGTIYRHFESKADLVDRLYEKARATAHQSIVDVALTETSSGDPSSGRDVSSGREGTLRERLWSVWRAVILNYVEHPRLYRFILKYESSAYLRAGGRAQVEDLRDPFRRMYEEGVEAGVFAPLPRGVYASFFTGAASHLVQRHLQSEAVQDETAQNEAVQGQATQEGSPGEDGPSGEGRPPGGEVVLDEETIRRTFEMLWAAYTAGSETGGRETGGSEATGDSEGSD